MQLSGFNKKRQRRTMDLMKAKTLAPNDVDMWRNPDWCKRSKYWKYKRDYSDYCDIIVKIMNYTGRTYYWIIELEILSKLQIYSR